MTNVPAQVGIRSGYQKSPKRPEHLNRSDSGFSLTSNGDEAQQRLDDFAAMVADAEAIYARLPKEQKPAFYEMILYPARGSNLVNRRVLLAERSRLWGFRA